MALKNMRTSNRSKELTYLDVEKALKGRDLNNLSYKDMYELEQLGFGDWLKRNAGNVGMTLGGAGLAGLGALGTVVSLGLAAPVTGAMIGSGITLMSSGIEGMSSDSKEQRALKSQNSAIALQNSLLQQQAEEQAMFQRTANDPIYGAVYADGGVIEPIIEDTEPPIAPIPKSVAVTDNQRADILRQREYVNALASIYIDHFRGLGHDVVPFLSKYDDPNFDYRRTDLDNYVNEFHTAHGDLQLPAYKVREALKKMEDQGYSYEEFVDLNRRIHNNPINKAAMVDIKGGRERQKDFDDIGFGIRQLLDIMGGKAGQNRLSFLEPYRSIPQQAFGGYAGLPRFQAGGTINYEGQSHEGPNQGIPVDEMGNPSIDPVALTEGKEVAYSSDQGTYIFSDRLKYSDSKTFAQRAKDLQKKYGLRAKTKGGTFQLDDPISKKGYDMDMQELIGQQEQLKEMTMPQQPQPQQMGYEELPMHSGYGSSVVGLSPRFDYRKRLNADTKKFFESLGATDLLGKGKDFGIEGTDLASAAGDISQLYSGAGLGSAAISMIPELASAATNYFRGRKRLKNNPYDKLIAPEVMAEKINLENERATMREQANVARANTSRGLRAGAATAGSYMANMIAGETGIQRGLGQQLGQSYQNEAVTNAQMRQQAAMSNQQARMQANAYNAQMQAQNQAQADAMITSGISQFGQGFTNAYNQYMADRRHVEGLNMMNPDYAMYDTTPSDANWWQRNFNRTFDIRLRPEARASQQREYQTAQDEKARYQTMKTTQQQNVAYSYQDSTYAEMQTALQRDGTLGSNPYFMKLMKSKEGV